MGFLALEELADALCLPVLDDLGLDVLDAEVLRYLKGHPDKSLVLFDEDGLVAFRGEKPVFDMSVVAAYERDLNDAYMRAFRRAKGLSPRRLKFNDLGLKLVEFCVDNPGPYVEHSASGHSDLFVPGFVRALNFDLRYAAKLAEDDARSRRGGRNYVGGALLALSLMASSFFGAYLGMSLAVDRGIERARAEFREEVDSAVRNTRVGIREEIDDAVSDYGRGFFQRASSGDQPAVSPKPQKLEDFGD